MKSVITKAFVTYRLAAKTSSMLSRSPPAISMAHKITFKGSGSKVILLFESIGICIPRNRNDLEHLLLARCEIRDIQSMGITNRTGTV